MLMMRNLFALCFCWLSLSLYSQTVILIENPSFEEAEGTYATIPDGWTDCGFEGESPPDVFSGKGTHFGRSRSAKDGQNGLCMISRIDNTWEGLGQKLSFPLEKGKIHFLHLYAMRSPEYLAIDRLTGEKENFNLPLQLYLWGSKEACESKALLGVSQLIKEERWEKINFVFQPEEDFSFLWVEVRYDSNSKSPYRGNMLIDNFSPIQVWTDTIRYQAYCIEGEFVGFVDKKGISAASLELLARKYLAQILQSNQYSGWDISNLMAIEILNEFEEKVKVNGLRQFILSQRPTKLRAVLNALEKIGAKDHWNLLREGIQVMLINRNGNVSEEENNLFENLDEKYLELRNLSTLRLEYINENKTAILNEMQRCG